MNEKNLAPKNIEGTYTLTIEGKTISITDSSGRTKTANCAHGDIFNLGEGVNLAMDRLYDKTIRVGDIVKVTDPGLCYTTYVDWIAQNIKSIMEAACYAFSKPAKKDCVYKVIAIAPHTLQNNDLCYIKQMYYDEDGYSTYVTAPCYLINVKGVEKI